MPYEATQSTLRGSLPNKLFEETPPSEGGPEDLYHVSGLTIYRTVYGRQTETSWEALIQTIPANVQACVSEYYTYGESTTSEDEEEAGKLLLNFFRLDNRSGLSLKGKSLDDLRDSYLKEPFHWSKDEEPDCKDAEPRPPVCLSPTPKFSRPLRTEDTHLNASTWTFTSEIMCKTLEFPRVIGAGCR